MNRLKLGVVIFIILLFAVTAFVAPTIKPVSGQNAGVGLNAPTALKATDSVYATKVGLHWEPVPYAIVYRVFRSATNDSQSAISVGSTSANFFFDATAIAGQQYFYWVRAENSESVSPLGSSDAGMRAVGNNSPGAPFPPLEPPIVPGGNPLTAAKAYLGKTLFWDEQLSSTKTVSCGTCHRPAAGGSDPRTNSLTRHPGFDGAFNTDDDVFGSPGVPNSLATGEYSSIQHFGVGLQVTNRRSPSYLNAGYTTDGIFWDGRARDQFRDPITNSILLASFGGLESQSVFPPLSTAEMGHVGRDWPAIVTRLNDSRPLALAHDIPSGLANWLSGRTYPQLFEEAFGTPEITPARIAMAIATHERMLFSDQTPLDRWSAQLEPLTTQEEQGRTIFIAQQCTFCHGGALLSNASYQNVGVRPINEDPGRGAVTGVTADFGRFKTPPLRNLELKGNYFHNGRFATVEDVVEFYNRGGDFDAPNVDPRIQPLNLTIAQRAALVSFLKRPLTDQRVAQELPPFDRPKLYTESTYVPTISGNGRIGAAGITPNAIALEPPVLGNPRFTVSVSQTVGGSSAVLVIDAADPGVGTSIPASGSFARVETTLSGSGGENGYGSAVLSIPNDPSIVGRSFYGRWYVTDAGAANGFSVSRLITFTIFGNGGGRAPFDFDGDGKTEISIYRPAAGEWWYERSSNGTNFAAQFGNASDKPVPADYTGDGKTDIAFWRPSNGNWFVLRSEDLSFYAFPFGLGSDVTIPADYDGDGKADAAVFRPSTNTWYIQRSSGGTDIIGFGSVGDKPVPADYDGDGRADIAVFRPKGASGAEWWVRRSSNGSVFALVFGASVDKPVQGDYTGDGKTDIAFWRPSNGSWFILRSEDLSFYSFPFGTSGDLPLIGDFDGDGKSDPGVFRPSTSNWFVQRSTAGTLIRQFGVTGDLPIPNSFVP
ncbi:MAG: VCBS repeat-containing protein [Pyrinomonadaceae bacterium]|nr:VCBS repeat-containing protein [Pyrinomonadaceae bacterium]